MRLSTDTMIKEDNTIRMEISSTGGYLRQKNRLLKEPNALSINTRIIKTPTFALKYARRTLFFISTSIVFQLNGINTQGENMADNGGVKAAYKAYKKWVYQNGQEAKLPGLTYTPEQLFWLSFANAFCSKSRPEYSKLIITTDEHSPAMFRVIGSLSNIPEFAKDFHCKAKTKMNPTAKCVLW